MTRVLLVGRGTPERGGIPTFLAQLAEGVPGHEVRLLNLARPDMKEGGKLSGGNLTRTFQDVRSLLRAARDVDIVHIHSALSGATTIARAGALATAARARGRRVLVHAHGGRFLTWGAAPRRAKAARIALTPAHRIIAVSDELARALEPVAPGRVAVVHNGVEVDRFHPAHLPPTNDSPVVLFVGGLTPRKGLIDLFTASAEVVAAHPHRLVVVGGTPDEGGAAEEEVRASARVHDHVELRAFVARDELPDVYRSADVFCLPSWWEAAPLTILEAAASGLPVIATTVGDVPAMVDDGTTGRLVAPRDIPALRAALVELLSDGRKRRAWGAAGRSKAVDGASVDAMRATLAGVYDDVAGAT